jgi:hypothetical protein
MVAKTYQINDPVKMLETPPLQDSRVHVILQVAIIEWNSDAIQAQACKIFGIGLSKEVPEPTIEEKIVLLLTKHSEHCGTMP